MPPIPHSRDYFDPRTGERITGDEFVRRYSITAFVHVEHPPAPKASTQPGLASFPVCIGCGIAVEVKGDVCATCAQKPQYQGRPTGPTATRVLAPQPEPAYAPKPESAPVTAPDQPLPPGTVIGSASQDGY